MKASETGMRPLFRRAEAAPAPVPEKKAPSAAVSKAAQEISTRQDTLADVDLPPKKGEYNVRPLPGNSFCVTSDQKWWGSNCVFVLKEKLSAAALRALPALSPPTILDPKQVEDLLAPFRKASLVTAITKTGNQLRLRNSADALTPDVIVDIYSAGTEKTTWFINTRFGAPDILQMSNAHEGALASPQKDYYVAPVKLEDKAVYSEVVKLVLAGKIADAEARYNQFIES